MHPSQPVLLNILKHDPTLLENFSQIKNKVYVKGVSLDQYHKKLKIFWPESINRQLVQILEQQLKIDTCNKAAVRALCMCMQKESLIQLLIQYKPQQDVINWATIDDRTLNIQRNLAMNMHIARPKPGPEIVFDYAKGDYLPFAVPALYSIFCNLNMSQSQKFIPMLLNRKVSLQKHGIRLAFMKLSPLDVKTLLTEVLKDNRNLTIRHVAFGLTFKVLCKQNNSARIQYFWPIMDNLLDHLTYQENKAIYDLLFEVEKLPVSVQSQFFPKAYKFLEGLMASKSNYYEDMKYSFKHLITYASKNVNILPPAFITSILLDYIDNEFPQVHKFSYYSKIELLSAYILCSHTKDCITEKYQTLLIPFLRKCFKHWNYINKDVENKEISEESMYIARICFKGFINTFSIDAMNFISDKNSIVPTEAFQIIKHELEQVVDTPCYYLTLTMLQLHSMFFVIFESCKQEGDDWDKTCSRMLPKLAQAFKDHLKEHCSRYFTNVYVLYERVIYTILTRYLTKSLIFELLQYILQNEKFIPLYLMVLKLIHHLDISDENTKSVEDLFGTISSHTSPEVQIHYYQCHNIHLKSITASMIHDKIKKKNEHSAS